MTDERQKKTTDQYRNNWDNIFKKEKDDKGRRTDGHDSDTRPREQTTKG